MARLKMLQGKSEDYGGINMTVKEAVKESGTLGAFHGGSIKEAESMLSPSETLIYAMSCNISIIPNGGALNTNISNMKDKITGILVITSARVYFCNNVLGQGTSKQIFINDITSVDDKTNLLQAARLRISGLTEMFVIDGNKKTISQTKQALNEARIAASAEK